MSAPGLFAGLSENKMATEEDDNELPEEIMSSLEGFYHAMNSVDESLETILSKNSEDIREKLDVLDRSKLDLMTVYAMNSMFWIYLITQGINPKEHGVKHELDRIKNYMGKIKEISDKKKALLKIDKDAAKRFVKSALWTVSDKKEKKDHELSEATETDEKTSKKAKRKKETSSGRRKKHKVD